MNNTVQFARVNDMTYRRWGPERPSSALVLCHGLASNGSRWSELADRLQRPDGCALLCPDLRGHGQSTYRGRLTSRHWINDLVAMLDQEGLERAIIGGHCMGANLAIRFAAEQPQRCQSLVLIEPMLPQGRRGKMHIKTVLRWLLPALSMLALLANRLGLRRRDLPLLDLAELDRQTRQAMEESGSEDAMMKRYASPLPDLQYLPTAAYLQALTETLKTLPPLAGIQQPTLALLSQGGLFGDPELTRRALTRLPAVQIEMLDAQHWIPTEQPDALRESIETWLSQGFG
ncbi:MAG: alpha/beta fold hydrolase [Wenzhouxiangella sp.]